MAKRSGPTGAKKILDYLNINKGKAFCDDCLAAELEMGRQAVNARTEAFGLCRDFMKEVDVCSTCKDHRKLATRTRGK